MSVDGATVVVVSAGYPGKRRAYVRMAELGASLVVVDEPGHWSESFVADGVAAKWLSAPVEGDPDRDAKAVLAALAGAGVRPGRADVLVEEPDSGSNPLGASSRLSRWPSAVRVRRRRA